VRRPGDVLLLSCYELGHQPVGVASPLAFLEREGYRPGAIDLSVEPHDRDAYARARFVGISVPMHTALRVGVAAAEKVRAINPSAHLCFYGSYALLNAGYLLAGPADSVLGGECETALCERVAEVEAGTFDIADASGGACLDKLSFPVPSRHGLPPLERYARLEVDGETRTAGAVETSRGCLHHCRHCPLPPVYGGRFFAVPRDVVRADVDRLVESGARHITFADPDFLNGPTHAVRVARDLHAAHPGVTFDITAKIEHLLQHREVVAELARLDCLFVVSAVESLNDEVLGHLDKGHTRVDVLAALELLDGLGIAMRPSLMPFTPWENLESYGTILDWIEENDLHEHVDPVQLSIRLLVPPGSRLLDHAPMQRHLLAFEPQDFAHTWKHPDPRMDDLQAAVEAIAAEAARHPYGPRPWLGEIRAAWSRMGGRAGGIRATPANARRTPPRLTEPWFC
jgi:radical SAM superfamily enzyme YgiQ (UPF0313 family)